MDELGCGVRCKRKVCACVCVCGGIQEQSRHIRPCPCSGWCGVDWALVIGHPHISLCVYLDYRRLEEYHSEESTGHPHIPSELSRSHNHMIRSCDAANKGTGLTLQ